MSGFELVPLKTGVVSLRSLENMETFHPVTGPRVEATVLHVKQQRLLERAIRTPGPFVIWDVGFGAAANALAAVEAFEGFGGPVEIHSFDKTTAPVEFAISHSVELEYLHRHLEKLELLLTEKQIKLPDQILWNLHLGDFRERIEDRSIPAPHAMLYDPYSPVGNPDMWNLSHFENLYRRLDPNVPCLLSNYTRSTAVRVTLLLAGFYVGIGAKVGEKNETTVAANRIELIERPLRRGWIEKVRVSKNSVPLTGSRYSQGLIGKCDFDRLARLPQFQDL